MSSPANEVAPRQFHRGARRSWHQRRRQVVVRQLVAGLQGDALDYGCGWGDISQLVAPAFRTLVGVDVSPDRIAFAQSQYPELRFAVCRADGLDFPDASFDVALSIVVLPFVPDVPHYLAECARVLRPGGHLVVMIPNPHSNFERIYQLARRQPPVSVRLPSLAHFKAELAAPGFVVESEACFYDPPFDRVANVGDLALTGLDMLGHIVGNRARASYIGYTCRLGRP